MLYAKSFLLAMLVLFSGCALNKPAATAVDNLATARAMAAYPALTNVPPFLSPFEGTGAQDDRLFFFSLTGRMERDSAFPGDIVAQIEEITFNPTGGFGPVEKDPSLTLRGPLKPEHLLQEIKATLNGEVCDRLNNTLKQHWGEPNTKKGSWKGFDTEVLIQNQPTGGGSRACVAWFSFIHPDGYAAEIGRLPGDLTIDPAQRLAYLKAWRTAGALVLTEAPADTVEAVIINSGLNEEQQGVLRQHVASFLQK